MIEPSSDEDLMLCVNAWEANGRNITHAADAIGMQRTTFRNRMARASQRGLTGYNPVLPGYSIKAISSKTRDGAWVRQVREAGPRFTVPKGHVVKGISALTDQDGNTLLSWQKTTAQRDPADIVAIIKTAFENYEPSAPPVPGPAVSAPMLMTLYPLADWHLGMFSWGKETGTDWDLKIAESVIYDAMSRVVIASPDSADAVILGGGDLLHSDNSDNQTSRSGNALDVDGRYEKVLEVACRLMARVVDLALRKHRRVTVRILKGNHDEHACIAVTYHLAAWFRNEPRVTIDKDPSLFWFMSFGKTFLAATHGHEAKAKDMPSIMASRKPEQWGQSLFRYGHAFHRHHKEVLGKEDSGVIVETHQTPAPPDSWHFGRGFLSGRSVKSITYDSRYGEDGRVTKSINDAVEPA